MKFDVDGRIQNMSLPDGRTGILFAVYEGVSNAIHAIEDRYGADKIRQGRIEVTVDVDENRNVDCIFISDDGIGFTQDNLNSFDTSDSRVKYSRGGKGVGRLIWFKLFDTVFVESAVSEGSSISKINFDYDPRKNPSFSYYKKSILGRKTVGSTISLQHPVEIARVPIRKISLMRDLAAHFFPYFLAGNMPDITITVNGRSEKLRSFIEDRIEEPSNSSFDLEIDGVIQKFGMTHVFAKRTLSRKIRNSILFSAHSRIVGDPIEIERRFALNDLAGGNAYVGLVEGPFFDEHVDQERQKFRFDDKKHIAIRDSAIICAGEFLEDHVKSRREKQKASLEKLLNEHPQFLQRVSDVEEYLDSLYPGMDEEAIGENLFTLLYRDERKVSKKLAEFEAKDQFDEESKIEAKKIYQKVSVQAKNRLAELVVKRRQILTLAQRFIRRQDGDDKYHLEKQIHGLICPLGEFYKGADPAGHNLWILDDLLAYYSYFASDKQVRSFAEDSDSASEPDVTFFNPLGFRRNGTSDPVVIVEFKRPGDETTSSDPVNQVLEYIEKLRNKTVRAYDGEVVSEIGENTPFECYIVCDLTEGTRRLLARSIASYETPDGQGFFGYAPQHKALVNVISYRKMLHDAERRNEVFFKKLGLLKA